MVGILRKRPRMQPISYVISVLEKSDLNLIEDILNQLNDFYAHKMSMRKGWILILSMSDEDRSIFEAYLAKNKQKLWPYQASGLVYKLIETKE